jgi:hypothetical protein
MDSMATLSPPPARVKTSIVTCEPFAIGEAGLGVLLTTLAGTKGCCTLYRCTRIDCPDLAYQLDKLHSPGSDPEAEGYAVNLSLSTCECRGFLRHGTCKHLTGCRSRFERGCLS